MDQEQTIALSQPLALAKGKVTVDRENGQIKNVAILSRGPALTYGFDVDDTMLRQCRDGLKQAGRLKSHLTHAHAQGSPMRPAVDGLTSMVGHVIGNSAHIEDGVVRGDVQLGKFAAHSPQGNMRDFLLDAAEEQPEHMGLSIVFAPDESERRVDSNNRSLPPAGRIKELKSVDFVGDPASNTHGLLSVKPSTEPTPEGNTMKEAVLQHLTALGLPSDSSEEQSLAFLKTLSKPTEQSSAEPGAASAEQVALERKQAAAEAVRLERARSEEIVGLSKQLGLDASWSSQMVNGGFTVAQAKEEALKKLAANRAPLEMGAPQYANNQPLKALGKVFGDAIMLRAGCNVENASPDAKKYLGLSVLDMCRQHLAALGVPDAQTLSRTQIVGLLGPREFAKNHPHLVGLAQSVGDFPSILADTINKTLRQAYIDAPRTWNVWARRATAPDFKNINRAALSESPSLTQRQIGGEVNYVTLSDGTEVYNLAEYASGLRLTRRALVNDDLDAFQRLPMLQALAAARLEDDVAYGVITTNANMADGNALFSSAHANLITSGGAAPSVATMAATEKLLHKQKGPKGAARLELRARFLLVPSSIYRTTQQAISSTVDPAKNNAAMNPFFNEGIVVVPSARLDDSSATAWYMVTDFNTVDTVEMCFLQDEPEPVAKQETDFDTDDMRFLIRHTVAGKAIDFRGMVKNPGA